MLFFSFISIMYLFRGVEQRVSKRNEQWLLSNHGIEIGQVYRKYEFTLQLFFLISFLVEVQYYQNGVSGIWQVILPFIVIVQWLKMTLIKQSGQFWSKKKMVILNVFHFKTGLFKHIRYPLDIITALEIVLWPLLFNAYMTSFIFTLLHTALVLYRIPAEETEIRSYMKKRIKDLRPTKLGTVFKSTK